MSFQVSAICKEKTKSVGNYFLQCGKTNPVEHVGPALQGDALEHCQHRLTKIVEARDAPLRSLHTSLKGQSPEIQLKNNNAYQKCI